MPINPTDPTKTSDVPIADRLEAGTMFSIL